MEWKMRFFSFLVCFSFILCFTRTACVCATPDKLFLASRGQEFYIIYHWLRQTCPNWDKSEDEALGALALQDEQPITAFQRLEASVFPQSQLLQEAGFTNFVTGQNVYEVIRFCDMCMTDVLPENLEHLTVDHRIWVPFRVTEIVNAETELIITERAYAGKLWDLTEHLKALQSFADAASMEIAALEWQQRMRELEALTAFHLRQSILMEEMLEKHFVNFAFALTSSDIFQLYNQHLTSRFDVQVITPKTPFTKHLFGMVSPFLHGMTLTSYSLLPMQRLCKYPLLLKSIKKEESSIASERIENMLGRLNEHRAVADLHANVLDWKGLQPQQFGPLLFRVDDVCIQISTQKNWSKRIMHLHKNVLLFYKKKSLPQIIDTTTSVTPRASAPNVDDGLVNSALLNVMTSASHYALVGRLSLYSIVSLTFVTDNTLEIKSRSLDDPRLPLSQLFLRMQTESCAAKLFDLIQFHRQHRIQDSNVQ